MEDASDHVSKKSPSYECKPLDVLKAIYNENQNTKLATHEKESDSQESTHDPANQAFQAYFLSRRADQAIYQSEQDKLAKIDRHISILEVPRELQEAFIIARGRVIQDKVNNIPNIDIDTRAAFNHRYRTEVIESREDNKVKIEIYSYVSEEYKSLYRNYIDIDNGVITASNNQRKRDKLYDKQLSSGKVLPNSEILYNQILSALEYQKVNLSNFDLRQVVRENIWNKETWHTLDFCIENFKKDRTLNTTSSQFSRGSDGYDAILGTPNAYGILFLIRQHPSAFGNRYISSIEAKRPPVGDLDLIFHISKKE
jgi:hypothetical protein